MSSTEQKKEQTLTIKLAKPDEEGEFTFVIKSIDTGTYYMLQKMIRSGKQFEAYVQMIKSLRISGDDPSILLSDDTKYLRCLIALDEVLAEMLEPVNVSIKKN